MLERRLITEQNIERLQKYIYPSMCGINIVSGCGERVCQICSENSPEYQYSMDFDVLAMIFQTFNVKRENPLILFGRGDPIYYRNKGRNISDVFKLAVENDVSVNARTHGCLHYDYETRSAVSELVEFLLQAGLPRDRAMLDFSVDPYGWFGISPQDHRESVKQFYDLIKRINPIVFAMYNENAKSGEFGNMNRVLTDLEQLGIPLNAMFQQAIHFVRDGDRPSRLVPKPPRDTFFKPWSGTFIEPNGDIIYTDEILGIQSAGNIFQSVYPISLKY